MPELPEVETTRRGLAPHIEGATVTAVIVRTPRLRWPIPDDLPHQLTGLTLISLRRRAKYLLLDFGSGTLTLHLGMSGSLRILSDTPPDNGISSVPPQPCCDPPAILARGMSEGGPQLCCDPPAKHDHFDLVFDNGKLMRLRDPRKFGAVLWHTDTLPLLENLGPEPLDDQAGCFDADYLYQHSRDRTIPVKQFIMDNHIVVGVGNIYASESLFRAGILPQTRAGKLTHASCEKLVFAIRATLNEAILAGGSTLRDFVNASGNPGYFQQQHWVYGRAGEPCRTCATPVALIKLGQRSSFYCASCQK